MFKETEEGQTHFCEACEQEGKVLPITSEHTCGLNKPTKKCKPEKHLWDCNEYNPKCHICGKLMRDSSIYNFLFKINL